MADQLTPSDQPYAGEPFEPLRLIHFGDLHLWRMGWDRDPFLKRLLGLANLKWRRGRIFPEQVAEELVDHIGGEEATHLLFSGDLCTTGLKSEYEAGRDLFQPLFERWGKRLICIPGNHDRYTPKGVRKQLFEKIFLQQDVNYPFSVDLNDQWTLVGFDCSRPRLLTSTGSLSSSMLGAIEALVRQAREKNRHVIVMGHYPLVYPPEVKPSWDHALAKDQRRSMLEMFERRGVRLYLHGHKHKRWRLHVGETTHINCGSAGMMGLGPHQRPGYAAIRVWADGRCEVEAVHLVETVAELKPDSIHWARDPLAARELDLEQIR